MFIFIFNNTQIIGKNNTADNIYYMYIGVKTNNKFFFYLHQSYFMYIIYFISIMNNYFLKKMLENKIHLV